MSRIVSRSGRTTQSIIAIGAVVVAAATVCIIQIRRSRKREKDGTSDDSAARADDEIDFFEKLGVSEENLPPHIRREIHKEMKRKSKVELISMKTKMYDNAYMLDTHREPMCTISMKKAKWYIRKGLAEWSSFKEGADAGSAASLDNMEEEVKCIRLLFEHNGYESVEGSPEDLYQRSAKKNVCVVCGDDGHHIRHYIVPYSYRTLLPEEYKQHMSHDIVILCPDCHLECERPTKRRMKEMERELRMRAGEGAYDTSPVIDDPRLHHVRSCAIALVKWKENIPTEKVEAHEKEVRGYLAKVCRKEEEKEALLSGNEELTKEQLQKACSVNYRVKNPNFVHGSEIVVRSLNDAKSIEEFIIDWRKHFLSHANPQHMPTGWSVYNHVICGARKDGGDDDGAKL